ncbi:hypothetical protein C7M84_022460 [Penaeus vannamei]|uniref:K Homology domain-containing protein n=1 Tax=Penaeus vannamei TaxID=6689 RepID=A0A423U6M0_PENVA|nr:hypothetical protein C7M84_022460 [Penaeus vannamei]
MRPRSFWDILLVLTELVCSFVSRLWEAESASLRSAPAVPRVVCEGAVPQVLSVGTEDSYSVASPCSSETSADSSSDDEASESSVDSQASSDLEDDEAFATHMYKPALYVVDRRRFLQQAAKATEKYGVKLVRPHAGNLVEPFLVKGKQEAARAFIQHMRGSRQRPLMTRPRHRARALRQGHRQGRRPPQVHHREVRSAGKSESVRGAIRELEELVQQDLLKRRVVLPVNILPEDIGFAIGKSGCHAAQIQQEFGVRLRTHSREHPQSPLVVEGPLDAAEKAVASIKLHVAERRRLNEAYAEERRRREELRGTIPVCILVTGLKEDARAAVAELEFMAKLKLHVLVHVLVPLRIKPEDHILVLGPEGCRAAWLEREYAVRF